MELLILIIILVVNIICFILLSFVLYYAFFKSKGDGPMKIIIKDDLTELEGIKIKINGIKIKP